MATFSKQELVVEAFKASEEACKLSTVHNAASPDVSSHYGYADIEIHKSQEHKLLNVLCRIAKLICVES